eukprot:2064573-Ditylum_brightwellii.AAC.1
MPYLHPLYIAQSIASNSDARGLGEEEEKSNDDEKGMIYFEATVDVVVVIVHRMDPLEHPKKTFFVFPSGK